VAGEKWLVWLYNNPVGEATLWALAKRKVVSSVYGNRMDRPSSTKKILAYDDISNSDFIIKGYRFDIFSFLNNARLAQNYLDGTLVIIRLAPFDYHRFHFPISGNVSPITRIDGDYYSVSPLALRKITEIFCLNKREFTIISNPLFGDVIMTEVGATMVGSIVQTYTGNFVKKGEEKGYFKFGGSTVVLLFEKNKIRIDDDLLINTLKGYETVIKEGERIGASMPGSRSW
jgi:phosphatidylserine decarboxylase